MRIAMKTICIILLFVLWVCAFVAWSGLYDVINLTSYICGHAAYEGVFGYIIGSAICER